jgi:hypothetical protein
MTLKTPIQRPPSLYAMISHTQAKSSYIYSTAEVYRGGATFKHEGL